MRSKQAFISNIIGYLALFIGVAVEHWGIAVTLFYFVIEASVYASVAGNYFKGNGRKKKGTVTAFAAGFGAFILTAHFAMFLAMIAGEFKDPGWEFKPIVPYVIQMVMLSWPLIIYKVIITFYQLRKLDEKTIENSAWSELIHGIMSLMIAFILTLALLRVAEVDHALTILVAILISRILFDLYLYRSVLGLSVKKKE